MLNMALLNIMGSSAGSGGMPDISGFNIFGLMSPAVNGNIGMHYPSIVHIWNRHLTCFLQDTRCEDTATQPTISIGVGGTRVMYDGVQITFSSPYKDSSQGVANWGISTIGLKSSYRELEFGFVDMRYGGLDYQKDIGKSLNEWISGYSFYWEHLPPIPSQMNLLSSANLAGFIGGTVWQCGISNVLDAPPAYSSVYMRNPQYTPVIDNTPRAPSNWTCIVVPIRGLTNFPKDDLSNCMMIGFMQLEYPEQIGYGLSYSFGIAKDPDCLPKKSTSKCGGGATGLISWNPAPQLFAGFAPFNLDNFLEPFIRAGKLRSYADAKVVYQELLELLWNIPDSGVSTYRAYPDSAHFYKSKNSIWQGLIDGWLQQPYKDIFNEIGADPMYYIHALQQQYPTECNFKSIMGCGRSFDRGVNGNSAICAMTDAMSVFKALATYPEEFPVDLPKLVARVG